MSESQEPNFSQLRVAAFESRRADDMSNLIERCGGQPSVSPSMREVPLSDTAGAVDFAHRLITGGIDAVIFLTGVGVRQLLEQVEKHIERQRFLDAVSDIVTVARGPKPVAALRELGITPSIQVPEPNTWREVLQTLDEQRPVANMHVGLQEYGLTNPSLIAGLEARGATVHRVRVYEWDLPTDVGPLEENVRGIAAGNFDVALFTSGQQVHNVLKLAQRLGLEDDFRRECGRLVVASIGPTTTEVLRATDLPVDLEPEHPKMGHLVLSAAKECHAILARKRLVRERIDQTGPPPDSTTAAPWDNSPMMRACRREPTDFTPIWLMRQAGRYLPEYRRIREQTSFMELCRNPSLASEVMCLAVQQLGVDAGIIFSDLLPILEPMGLDLEFTAGGGPVIHNPVRESTDVGRLVELESADALHFVMETVTKTRADLPDAIPLIGFAGAPFTLASYAIEGGASRNYLHTKTLMYRDGGAWDEIMSRLARAVTLYLNAQIGAGAQIVQIFDSWAGCLSVNDYRRHVLPYVRRVIDGLSAGTPVIHFATGNPALLPLLAEAGGDVLGIDWRIRLADGWEAVGSDRGVQGNLDPALLLAETETIRAEASDILQQAAGRPGHIFNLGHGVLPQTPPDHARALVDAVHELSDRRGSAAK